MRRYLRLMCIMSLLSLPAPGLLAASYYTFDTTLHPNALCADGTTAGMWVEPGSNDEQWVIHLLDGGACHDGESCRAQRNNPNLRGLGLFSSAEIDPPGPAPHDPTRMDLNGRQVGDLHQTGIWAAPTLQDAWIVVVNYCSQDHMVGSRRHYFPELNDPLWTHYGDFPTAVDFSSFPFRIFNVRFFGRHIMDAALGALVDGDPVFNETVGAWTPADPFPFAGADEVVLAASSAGTGAHAFSGHETIDTLSLVAAPDADYRFVFDGNFDLVDRPPNWDVAVNTGCPIDPTLTFAQCDRARGIAAADAWDSQGDRFPDQDCLDANPLDDTVCYRMSYYVDELAADYPLFTRAALYDNTSTPVYAYPETDWLSPPANPTPLNVSPWYTSTFQTEFTTRLDAGFLHSGSQHVTIRNGVCDTIDITVDPDPPFPIVRNCRREIGRFVGRKREVFSLDDTLP